MLVREPSGAARVTTLAELEAGMASAAADRA